mgnify:CR=1 FL=1
MKIRNSLFENKQYFETINKIHSSDQLSVMDAYRVNRLVKKLNELNKEYSELKSKLLTQYGKPGEEEGQFVVEGDSRDRHRVVFGLRARCRWRNSSSPG